MSESKCSPPGDISAKNSLPVEGRFQEIQSGSRLLEERKLLCKICDIDFSTFPSLKDHLSAYHVVKYIRTSYFCQPCDKPFQNLKILSGHLHREHTVEKIDACLKCRSKLPHEVVVPTRLSGETHLDHYCVVCQQGKVAEDSKTQSGAKTKKPSGSELADLKNRRCGRTTVCRVCEVGFVSSVALRDHLLTKHGSKSIDDPHLCAICQKAFLSLYRLVVHHQTAHVARKPFACGTCGKKFLLKNELRKHSKTHKPPEWSCDVCQKELRSVHTLRVHMLSHLGILPYECTACDKRYASKVKLKRHLISHTGEKPYSCGICGKGFTTGQRLKTHAIVHTRQKPFVCDVCQKGFIEKWLLAAHRRIHTDGRRPVECDVCQERFVDKSQLETHLLTHVKNEPEN